MTNWELEVIFNGVQLEHKLHTKCDETRRKIKIEKQNRSKTYGYNMADHLLKLLSKFPPVQRKKNINL